MYYIFHKCLVESINKAIKAILDLKVLDQGTREFIDLEVLSKSLKTLPRTPSMWQNCCLDNHKIMESDGQC